MFLKNIVQKIINIGNPNNSNIWGILKSLNENFNDVNLINEYYIIGRKSENKNDNLISLEDNRVSHKHFKIFISENKVHLQDTSRNGTYVNNNLIGKGNIITLYSNDIIKLGQIDGVPTYKIIINDFENECSDSEYSDITEHDSNEDEINNNNKRLINNSKKEKTNNKGKEEIDDLLDDELKCGICYEIMYNATTCSPCMHSFCAGCLSQWLNNSKDCPHCRTKIREIRKNNQTNNIINAFLLSNPEKKRNDEDLADLDKIDTIKNNIIRYEEENGNEIKYLYKDEDEFYYLSCPNCPSNDDNQNNDNDMQVLVRRYDDMDNNVNYRVKRKVLPQYADYCCPPRSVHILCHACRQQMPLRCSNVDLTTLSNRRRNRNNQLIILGVNHPNHSDDDSEEDFSSDNTSSIDGSENDNDNNDNNENNNDNNENNNDNNDNNNDNNVFDNDNNNNLDNNTIDLTNNQNEPEIPQQCNICKNYYCDKYMENGCENMTGRLDKIKDFSVVDIPASAFRFNNFEKQILVNYLDSKNMTVNDCWKKCIENLLNKKFQLENIYLRNIQEDTFICYNCSRQIFSELIYQYREKEVNKDDLPENIRNRPDCWYGRKCRTQTNKQDHARNYNHICEQTHF
ncbi:hypothetical protein BCR36DRAFT_579502 [Piromyces finnis]|uniref:E3 ubiquitin-protein ligase CHFR n=1 Tax=Piromyces finnis TaxID=1754191 RepID=A0A1Y1VN72_9FUNG|nr:hypothetical protein BCR36DRAFT_579502 [Piromyces finnis]|eukprot:ORX60061.1 hypothetical protein BCR36DRAFT_579502 [Piromyces finnis]